MFEEKALWDSTTTFIGCDEVGRGPLAGPVVACAFALEPQYPFEFLYSQANQLGITDSKKLGAKKCIKLVERLGVKNLQADKVETLSGWGKFCLSEVSEAIIDDINILQASLLAMKGAAEAVAENITGKISFLVDGTHMFSEISQKNKKQEFAYETFIKGDSRCLSIALASIFAKVYRDQLMEVYDVRYPQYGFAQNAGYPTSSHRMAIEKHGPCPIHRQSFKGVKEFFVSH